MCDKYEGADHKLQSGRGLREQWLERQRKRKLEEPKADPPEQSPAPKVQPPEQPKVAPPEQPKVAPPEQPRPPALKKPNVLKEQPKVSLNYSAADPGDHNSTAVNRVQVTFEELVSDLATHYIGNSSVCQGIAAFVKERLKHPVVEVKGKVCMVLEGPCGCGKLTAVRNVARVMGLEIRVVNMIDFDPVGGAQPVNFAEQLRNKLTTKNMFAANAPIVVLQGFDGWSQSKRSATIKILGHYAGKATRQPKGTKKRAKTLGALSTQEILAIERRKRVCNPVVITTSDQYYADRKSLLPLGVLMKLAPAPADRVSKVIEKFAARLKFTIGATRIHELVVTSNGDTRFLLNQLELWRGTSAGSTKTLREMGYFDLTNYLFQPRRGPMKRRRRPDDDDTEVTEIDQAVDHDMLIPAISTNYTRALEPQDPDNSTQMCEAIMRCAEVSEALSICAMTSNPMGSFGTREHLVGRVISYPRTFKNYEFVNRGFLTMDNTVACKQQYLRISADSHSAIPCSSHRLHAFRWTIDETRLFVSLFNGINLGQGPECKPVHLLLVPTKHKARTKLTECESNTQSNVESKRLGSNFILKDI